MSKLIVRRKKQFFDFTYNYKIYIDGMMVREISSGQIVDLEIADDKTHTIFVKKRWLYSPTINMIADKEINIEVGCNKYADYYFLFLIVFVISNLIIKNKLFHTYILLLNMSVIFLLFILPFITRKNSLTIKQIV